MTDNRNPPSAGQVVQSVGCLLMAIPALIFFAALAFALFFGGD